ncbi:MAG TPA: carbohydrate ABC transporter permease [Thermotogota bacterium]|nr:carbohydrate ABC transporter permease [Thermotogota bacterium]HPJ87783.1 carbohydrate ABC transporter permease [Thermotogota bacterium]HPR95219.1 carbohydrate ABC transporter permease [Thermotogota bacterium]
MYMKTKKRLDTLFTEIALIIISIIVFLPLLLAITISFQTPDSVFSYPPKLLPDQFYFQNFIDAFKAIPYARLLLNSAVIAIAITFGKVITGVLAGYAFANFKFFGKRFAFAFLFATLFLPAETIMIVPLFLIMKDLGWINTYWALTIPFMASATNAFLFRQHFQTIPSELEDAAKIDGAGPMKYFMKILLPLSKSMIAGVVIINFVYSWNMYLWPLIVSMEDNMKTVQVGVKMLISGEGTNNWGVIMAGTLIAVLPTVIVFLSLQNLFVKSLVRSGVKG